METPKVYQAIANVTAALSKDGIAKSRKNASQGYSFRGIDDIYNSLAPELAKHKLCMLPIVLERTCEEKTSAKGTVLFYVNVKMAFDLVSAEDGSKHQIISLGEAMDTGDKATNKAQSAAYKYAALMAFCIPTEGDNDTENQTHEVKSKQVEPKKTNISMGDLQMKATDLVRVIELCENLEELDHQLKKHESLINLIGSTLPPAWGTRLMARTVEQRNALTPRV